MDSDLHLIYAERECNKTMPSHIEIGLNSICRLVISTRKRKTTRVPSESSHKSRPADAAYLFRSYLPQPFDVISPPRNFGVETNQTILNVCYASTAIPTYFEAARIQDDEFYEGGVRANNPTWDVLDEMFSLHGTLTKLVVSFGGGRMSSQLRFFNRSKIPKYQVNKVI